jgi:hypothetical protein
MQHRMARTEEEEPNGPWGVYQLAQGPQRCIDAYLEARLGEAGKLALIERMAESNNNRDELEEAGGDRAIINRRAGLRVLWVANISSAPAATELARRNEVPVAARAHIRCMHFAGLSPLRLSSCTVAPANSTSNLGGSSSPGF